MASRPRAISAESGKLRAISARAESGVVPVNVPDWLEPMAATLTQDRFTGPEWIFERKYDGIRLLAFKDGDTVRLLSSNKLPQRYPSVTAAIAGLAVRGHVLAC